MRCPSETDLTLYLMDMTGETSKRKFDMHLSECVRCRHTIDQLKRIFGKLEHDETWEGPSQDLVRKLIDIFPHKREAARAEKGFLHPPLVPDVAVRSGEEGSSSQNDPVRIVVQGKEIRGQVFKPDMDDLSGIDVFLLDHRGLLVTEQVTDEMGRFVFQFVKPGSYSIFIDEPRFSAVVDVEID